MIHENLFLNQKKRKQLILSGSTKKKGYKRKGKSYRTRLKEKSYNQKYIINYNEVFALISNIKSNL